MPSKLLVYNTETNQYGYIDWLYYRNSSASSGNWYSGNGFELKANYTSSPANLNFLSLPDNKVCVVCGNKLYRSFRVTPTFSSYTLPAIYYADDGRVYIGTIDKGESTAFGTATINYKIEFEYWTGGDNWEKVERTGSWSTANWCGGAYYAGQPGYWRKSVELNPADATALMTELRVEMERFSTYYVTHSTTSGRAGSFPIAFFDSNSIASSAKNGQVMSFIPCLYKYSSLGAPRGIYTNTSAFNSIADFSASNEPYTVTSGIPDIVNYYENGIPSIVTSYAAVYFGGAAPSDVGELDPDTLAPSSIYTPGGTSTDPHNPYPSGDSPYTVDPLDSGVETDSPDTDGTWELPFDNVSLDHAIVDSSQVGVYKLVGLTQPQLKAMADYMFSDTSVTEAWENLMKLIYGNITDTIVAIQEFPMDVSDSVGTDVFCFIGRDTSTGMFVGKALTSEYRSLDFGSIEVPRYSGTFYDFEPYTTLTLYIPYIGYIDMKPTEVVGSTLYISGWVHLSTGEVTINVRSSRTGLLGSYSGNIGRSIPISSADCTRLYAAIIETAAGIGGYASFGASASAMGGIEHADPHNMNVARGEYAQAVKAYGSAKRGVRGAQANMLEKQAAYEAAKEEFSATKTNERQEVQAAERAEREFNEAGLEAYSNAIDAVTSGFEVVRGTHMTPGAGRTAPQVCFLRIEVPHQNVSKNQKLLGYPCNSAEVLNSDKLHGYTELRMIDLRIPGISLTELQELESILKGGFYLP